MPAKSHITAAFTVNFDAQTRVTLVTDGKHPLSYAALLRVARSMKPVSQ